MNLAKHIGWDVTATAKRPDKGGGDHGFELILFSTSGLDDGAFIPPQDVRISGKAAITVLRDFLNDLLAEPSSSAVQNLNTTPP